MLEKLLEKMAEFDRFVLRTTAPESVGPQRRGSRGSDLSTLPTHLHLTDRLLDLYAQSQRVTVIRTTTTAVAGNDINPTTVAAADMKPTILPTAVEGNKSSIADKKLIETLKENITTLSKQLELGEEKKNHMDEEINRMKKEIINSHAKIEVLTKRLDTSATALAESQKLVHEMSAKCSEVDRMLSESHQRLEIETGTYQNILKVVLGKTSRLNENRELAANDCQTLVHNFLFLV